MYSHCEILLKNSNNLPWINLQRIRQSWEKDNPESVYAVSFYLENMTAITNYKEKMTSICQRLEKEQRGEESCPRIFKLGAGGLTPQMRALGLAEDPGLVPSSHTVVYNHP